MKPIQDPKKVKKMFAQGQPFLTDPESGYKYSMVARCPNDGVYSSVEQIERQGESLSRVVFRCSSCSGLFSVKRDDIYVC